MSSDRAGRPGLRWILLGVAAAAGGTGFAMASAPGARAGLSFVGGLALVVGAFEFGAFNIRFTGRYLPHLTLLVAMLSYATTAIALALVLAASSPRVVDGPAIASGLLVGLIIWIATEIARTRVRS
ncbi:MAG: hypothetical protein QOH56_324 [Pseudonocardiales bacterium]|jgi:hypothetical protein|nr:hypothetical protein [Frankiales bacterium]MDQ1734073.1 hypothetical protein [Pseudonocardiales bacterium]